MDGASLLAEKGEGPVDSHLDGAPGSFAALAPTHTADETQEVLTSHNCLTAGAWNGIGYNYFGEQS